MMHQDTTMSEILQSIIIIIIIKINGFSQKGFSEPIYKIIS
jgi:hypothetical protein